MRRLRTRLANSLIFSGTLLACGEAEKQEDQLTPQPPPVLQATSCDTPTLPELGTEREQVVGDGTSESCTEAALREAMAAGGHITFSCGSEPASIPISKTLVAKDGTWLDGAGQITLDGGKMVRIMETEPRAVVRVDRLTFRRGRAVDEGATGSCNGSGGALYRGWAGKLYVSQCHFEANEADAGAGFGGGAIGTASSGWMTIVASTFRNNRSPYAGAVYSLLSDLTVVDSAFVENEATESDGGALFTDGAYTPPDTDHGVHGGIVSLCGTRFEANRAVSSAGAGFLFTYGIDQVIIHRCEFRGNEVTSAEPGLGGALRLDAEAFVHQTLFAENRTAGQGGAIWMGRGPAIFENVTFHNNRAELWGGAISYGDRSITLRSCTVAQNSATKGVGALFGDAGVATASNTLFVANGPEDGPKQHCSAALAGSSNLVFPAGDDDACGDWLHEDPKLAEALAANGGPTETLALEPTSSVASRGSACPATDQRGEPRSGENCALGAFEP